MARPHTPTPLLFLRTVSQNKLAAPKPLSQALPIFCCPFCYPFLYFVRKLNAILAFQDLGCREIPAATTSFIYGTFLEKLLCAWCHPPRRLSCAARSRLPSIKNLRDVRTCSRCFTIRISLDPLSNCEKVVIFSSSQRRKPDLETVRNLPQVTGQDPDGRGPRHYSV